MINNLQQFETIYNNYRSMVSSLCRGFAKGDMDLTQDLVQDVFVNVWSALDNFRGESSHKTWIYRITVNTCLLQIRKDKKTIKVALDESVQLGTEHPSPTAAEREKTLYKAIGQLDDIDRLVIIMVLEEVSYVDIAKVIGITENNLRVKIHRIKSRIKTIINHE
ncbi:MAG: RNA polymerase sigma factor [Chryseolinea sp.]